MSPFTSALLCFSALGAPTKPSTFDRLDISLQTQTVAGLTIRLDQPGAPKAPDGKPHVWDGPITVTGPKGKRCRITGPSLYTDLAVISGRYLEIVSYSGSEEFVEFYDLKTCRRVSSLN